MDPNKTEKISVEDLKIDPLAEDLLDSPAMQPYMNLALAMMQQQDLGPATEAIAALPMEQRYVWRVASALPWAFEAIDTPTSEGDPSSLSLVYRRRTWDIVTHSTSQ